MTAVEFGHEALSERVGMPFTVDLDPDGTATLTLTQCSPLLRAGGYSSYTLTFRGAADQPLAQGTFEFSADGIQPSAVFIVPLAATADGILYEAVFNQRED